mmetsp:Transcript_7875/g.29172  ORF Transcript_7875/g.29172 Transcript_7875/m.29172 type:complete len:204 (-) Transcript_7875:1572-2183(-)
MEGIVSGSTFPSATLVSTSISLSGRGATTVGPAGGPSDLGTASAVTLASSATVSPLPDSSGRETSQGPGVSINADGKTDGERALLTRSLLGPRGTCTSPLSTKLAVVVSCSCGSEFEGGRPSAASDTCTDLLWLSLYIHSSAGVFGATSPLAIASASFCSVATRLFSSLAAALAAFSAAALAASRLSSSAFTLSSSAMRAASS